jgi:hypothetical protein
VSDYYEDRMAETLAALSGGKVTAMPTKPVERQDEMSTAELLRMTTLSGSHSIRRTMRGSWEPRERVDWSAAGWLRDPATGQFRSLDEVERQHD